MGINKLRIDNTILLLARSYNKHSELAGTTNNLNLNPDVIAKIHAIYEKYNAKNNVEMEIPIFGIQIELITDIDGKLTSNKFKTSLVVSIKPKIIIGETLLHFAMKIVAFRLKDMFHDIAKNIRS